MQSEHLPIQIPTQQVPNQLQEQSNFVFNTQVVNETQNNDFKYLESQKIQKLKFLNCEEEIPNLNSEYVKELSIQNCNIKSLKGFRLNNLTSLTFSKGKQAQNNDNLAQELNQFVKLKQISLYGWQIDIGHIQLETLTKISLINCGITQVEALRSNSNLEEVDLSVNHGMDVSALQYIAKLKRLQLERCNLVNINGLKSLSKLEELNLYHNCNIDITPLQYLTKLKILNLRFCGLKNVDALRPLINIQELLIPSNEIVFIQPLEEMKQLNKFDADENMIQDILTINQLPNFIYFYFGDQFQLNTEQLKEATKIRNISIPITSLRQIQKQTVNFQSLRSNIYQQIEITLQKQCDNQQQFIFQVCSLLQTLNIRESQQ
ncbi:leucine-rich_repeat domain-containing protein [Hexamita inflata]|uniref:Leucine-rich repeat domain-containing protein n=1 Tax=Hexamita inflata TaxID=28002 RepID=A0AA86Q1X5_9EUKA|nr:leucine-rich repeat domain-containing protein [Hexamita inflata]